MNDPEPIPEVMPSDHPAPASPGTEQPEDTLRGLDPKALIAGGLEPPPPPY